MFGFWDEEDEVSFCPKPGRLEDTFIVEKDAARYMLNLKLVEMFLYIYISKVI